MILVVCTLLLQIEPNLTKKQRFSMDQFLLLKRKFLSQILIHQLNMVYVNTFEQHTFRYFLTFRCFLLSKYLFLDNLLMVLQ